LSWTEGTFDSVISNAIGNFLTAVGENLIKKGSAAAAGALVGTAMAPGVGTVIGFIVGVLVETVVGELYSWLTGGKKEKDRAAAEAAFRAGDLIQKQHNAFTDNAEASKAEVRATSTVWQEKVKSATTTSEVTAVEKAATDEAKATNKPVPKDNLALAEQMMRDWVLQHAGDEDDENAETSEAQYEKTKQRVGMEGELKNQPDLFVHQSEYHLRAMGWSEDQIVGAKKQMHDRVQQTGHPEDEVATLSAADSMKITFTGPEFPDAFIAMLEKHSAFTVNDDGRAGAKDKQLVATLTLDLDSSDKGTVFIDEFEWSLRFADGRYGFVFHHKKPPRKNSVPLYVSPD
jgi:hypothetical protein